MPHIVIEYTPNLVDLPFDAMLAAVTRRLADSPEVADEADLKARVVGQQMHPPGFDANISATTVQPVSAVHSDTQNRF